MLLILSFQGKFIQTYHNDDNFYGLTLDAVESVAREGLACVVHMELEVRHMTCSVMLHKTGVP